MNRHSNNMSRTGFTLVELLVVIGILVLLVALIGPSLIGVLGRAKEHKTAATIRKIAVNLQQLNTDLNLANAQSPPRNAQPILGSQELGNLLAIKVRYREVFPNRFVEVADMGASPITPYSAIGKKLAQLEAAGTFIPANHDPVTESSELLYLILTEGSVYAKTAVDAVEFGPDEIKDADGDGLKEIVDAWGQPLRFYRWPTRLIRPAFPPTETDPASAGFNMPDPNDPNPCARDLAYLPRVQRTYHQILTGNMVDCGILSKDAGDATQILKQYIEKKYSATGDRAAEAQGIENNATVNFTFHTPSTYSTPLVLSSGSDLTLGLYEPHDAANFGHLGQPIDEPDAVYDGALVDDISNLSLEQ